LAFFRCCIFILIDGHKLDIISTRCTVALCGGIPHLEFNRKDVEPLSFKISALADLSGADSLMVAKIIDYPLEKAEYKPFAQARLCALPNGLAVQMWAFEAQPAPKSSLQVVLCKHGCPVVSAQLWSSGALEVLTDGNPTPNLCTLFPLWGEDLQGRYWGGSLVFDKAMLQTLWGDDCLEVGSILQGNLYKLSTDEHKPHMGSLFPADFAADPYSTGSFGEFEFVSY